MPDLSTYDPVFQAAGQEWNVDPTLLKAVAGQESGGNPSAVSSKGAQGLMQITPDTQKYLGITDPNDPVQSIYGAAKYLDEGLNKEGSPEGALLYYHGGPGWRQAYGPESQSYVPAVTARYQALTQAQAPTAQAPSSVAVAASFAPQDAAPLIVGDSLASPAGLGGNGVVGAVPSAIRSSVAADARKGTYQGQNVVLSSGASNAPGDMTNVEGQLQLLQNGGAKGITLLGVGPGVEAKSPGTNDALQGLATKYGATFVPLPSGQMSNDGVHPTARGYRTLLAMATPKTATDATPVPAAATGPGNAMASDDPLSLLPPAPKPQTGGARGATTAAPDGPLSLLPPAPVAAGTTATTQGTTLPGPSVPSADEQSADTGLPLPSSPPPGLLKTLLGLPNQLSPDQIAAIRSQTPLERIIQAGAEGGTGALDASGWAPGGLQLGRYIVNPLLTAGGALVRGGQQFIQEATPDISAPSLPPGVSIPLGGGRSISGQLTPGSLGRELAAMPEAFPTADYGQPTGPATAAQARNALNQPVTVADLTGAIRRSDAAAAAEASNALQPDRAAAVQPTAPATPPRAPESEPTVAPQPAGAQISPSDTLQLTPREAANTQLVADLQWLTKTKQPGVVDPNVYLEGITPTRAQVEQTVQSAREIKELKLGNPAVAQEDEALADLHNDIRKRAYGDVASSPLLTDRAIGAAGDKIEADLANVWQNKGEADTSGVTKQISSELSGSAGDLPPMRSGLKQIQDSVDAAGTDPQQLYKARRLVNYFQSKQAARENPSYGDADFQRSLVSVKSAIDQAIEPAAPGFQQAMSDYSTTMGPLNAQKELQARELGMQNSKGVMEYNRVHNLMRDVVVGRSPDTPTNPFQGLSDQQMDALKAIHDDLQRVATAKQLAAASGSDTAQNIVGLMKQYARMGAGVGVHGVANYMAPGVGSMAVRSFSRLVEPITAARTARRQVRAGMEALHPDLSKYPGGNPLNQPP